MKTVLLALFSLLLSGVLNAQDSDVHLPPVSHAILDAQLTEVVLSQLDSLYREALAAGYPASADVPGDDPTLTALISLTKEEKTYFFSLTRPSEAAGYFEVQWRNNDIDAHDLRHVMNMSWPAGPSRGVHIVQFTQKEGMISPPEKDIDATLLGLFLKDLQREVKEHPFEGKK